MVVLKQKKDETVDIKNNSDKIMHQLILIHI